MYSSGSATVARLVGGDHGYLRLERSSLQQTSGYATRFGKNGWYVSVLESREVLAVVLTSRSIDLALPHWHAAINFLHSFAAPVSHLVVYRKKPLGKVQDGQSTVLYDLKLLLEVSSRPDF